MPFQGITSELRTQERNTTAFTFTVYRDSAGNFQLIGLRGGELTVNGVGQYQVDLPGKGDYNWMYAFSNATAGTPLQTCVTTTLPGSTIDLDVTTSTGVPVDLANTEGVHVMVIALDKTPHNYDVFP